MSHLLEQVAILVQDIIRAIGYPGIVLIMLAENVFPPIPSEVIMPFGGFLVGRGEMNFLAVWGAGVLGSVLGALVLYYIGWWAGDTVLRSLLRRYGRFLTITEKEYDRALDYFGRYGHWVVFFGRLIPIIRSLISLPAGAEHMPMPKFLLYTTAGSAIWSGLLAYAGLVLGENWEEVLVLTKQYERVVLVALVMVAVAVVTWWIRRRRRLGVNVEAA